MVASTNLAVFGLLAGTGAMMAIASVVLAYRIARTQFTIASILVVIVVAAVFLAWARSLFL
jgi:hypothetical protein